MLNQNSLCAIATTAGEIVVLNTITGTIIGSIRLPGEVYSSPIVIHLASIGDGDGNSDLGLACPSLKILVGCRDDHIHCLETGILLA